MPPVFPTIDASRCTLCHACERACVERRYGPADDAMVLERRRLAVRVVAGVPSLSVCVHCTESPCVTVCPHFALLRFRDGRVELLEDRCTGCGKCIAACPYDAIRRVTALDIAVKCDGCGGDSPVCVESCPTDALSVFKWNQ